jgi:hypothetical protein
VALYQRVLRIDANHVGANYNLALISHTQQKNFAEVWTRVPVAG